jgi:hypothetical protein
MTAEKSFFLLVHSARKFRSIPVRGGFMKKVRVVMLSLLMVLLCGLLSPAQQSVATATNAAVPPLIPFSNVATDYGGSSLSGVVGITFSLYAAQQGGEPLWTETQNSIQLDATGHYSVQLGITRPNGVPTTLFTTGEARWLGVQIAEQGEQPRVLLLSVPYALKAGDAATIGGLPPSAFVLAASQNGVASTYVAQSPTAQSVTSDAAEDVTTTGGTADYLPLFSGADTIIDSALFQSGTGSTAKVGINTTTPATTLDVAGAATIAGTLALPATGAATATAGKASQPLTLAASAYNSGTPAAVNQTFQWQAEPADNDSATPSATLNLLFAEGTATPSQTGLHVSSNGQITFATGQTFPGTGDGTLTGITTATGSGLTGGGASGTLKLGLLTTCTGGQVLEWNGTAWDCATASGTGTITGVTAGTDLTGGGTSGNVTLNLNTTKIPQLSAANTFVGNQTVTGNLTASGEVQGGVVNATTSFDIGGTAFAIGSVANGNAFPGFAGNSTMTGKFNVASGWQALNFNTTGSYNTATGPYALYSNTTGSSNTASGYQALASNAKASYNTATGNYALYSNTAGSNNTASGFEALYSNTTGISNTASGDYALYSNTGDQNTATGFTALFNNSSGIGNTAFGYGSAGTADGTNITGSGNTAMGFDAEFSTGSLTNATAIGAYAEVGESNALVLGSIDGVGLGTASVNVGIGTTTPSYALDVETPSLAFPVTAVYGAAAGASVTGSGTTAGVWGDTGGLAGDSAGVAGTADDNNAGLFVNNSGSDTTISGATLAITNFSGTSGALTFQSGLAGGPMCTIDTSADLACTGTVSEDASVDSDTRKVALYSMQSPENWFEDAGSGQLSNGSTRIALDPTFAQTVNAGVEYHVFLTPNGDSKGLYVSQKTATSFEVHEQGGGTSSIAFDYRIMAKRRGYENVRLTDVTQQFNKREARRERMPHLVRPSAAPQSVPKIPTLQMHPLVAPRPVPAAPKLLPPPPVRAAVQPLTAESK